MRVGCCAHVTRGEFKNRVRTYEMMRAAGFTEVRSDFDWRSCQKERGGGFDFSRYDQAVDDAARHGITLLPILFSPPQWAQPVNDHIDEWRTFVRETARHFKDRLPAYEIWNEENIEAFWKEPDPVKYTEVLRAAYEEIKSVDPKLRVVFGGAAGLALDYIEKAFKAGATECHDVMNVHPYRHPQPAEPMLSRDLKALRDLMVRYGEGGKPIWITEMGWPTHRESVPDTTVLKAALKVARPNRDYWRAAFVDTGAPGIAADVMAAGIGEMLPGKSKCFAVGTAELKRRLPKKEFNLLVLPFNEEYPGELVDELVEFVGYGGTLVAFGGFPLYYSSYGGVSEKSGRNTREGAQARERLRIGVDAWWFSPKTPSEARVFPSPQAEAAGLRVDPAGLSATRFFNGKYLKEGDELVPILVGKDKEGGVAIGAGVYAFGSDMKGRVVVSSRGRAHGTSTEAQQATYVVDALEAAKAAGVEKFFIYEFQAPEGDPHYSEDHFGIVHADFSPKPAYEACRTLLRAGGAWAAGR